MSKRTLIISIATAAIIITSGTILLLRKESGNNDSAHQTLVNQAALDTLAHKDGSSADTLHLDAAIIPPTNSWLSGMVLQATPKAVYPMPLSFLAKESGFEIGLPTITVAPTTITGGHSPGIAASIEQASNFTLTRYDKISATLTYRSADKEALGHLTLAEGVPYIYYRALTDNTLTLRNINLTPDNTPDDHYLRYSQAGHDYVVATDDNASLKATGSTVSVTLRKNSLATFYALPDTGKDTLRQYAANELTSVTTTHKPSPDTTSTTLTYATANDQPTVYAPMGYSKSVNPGDVVVAYQNIYGKMSAYAGNRLTTTADKVPISTQLDISRLSAEHKATLVAMLAKDVAATKITAQDSYYGGKQLGRAANLLDIAKQLNQPEAANKIQAIMKDALAQRLDGKHFYYDPKLRGIAATTSAFGSEDFNDHHFHYGNFIYATSILGRYDLEFLTDYKDEVNLLVADIASYDASADFPVYRNYDAYAGHSWAAGLAPFADGNNQESTSEAMNAWNAVAAWGVLTDNASLSEMGQWLLANESATARDVWRSPPTAIPERSNFTSPITSLNFGGKLTYSTFFSDEPNAKLGIQLISMNPFMTQLAGDGVRISQLVDQSVNNNNFNVALADYLIMYLSLQEPQRAARLAANQQDAFIDDGNSRTYLNAFVFSRTDT